MVNGVNEKCFASKFRLGTYKPKHGVSTQKRQRSKYLSPFHKQQIYLVSIIMAVPWLRSLAADLSPRRPGFAPGSIHVEFVVDKVALG
jgi:hypothetical protein